MLLIIVENVLSFVRPKQGQENNTEETIQNQYKSYKTNYSMIFLALILLQLNNL